MKVAKYNYNITINSLLSNRWKIVKYINKINLVKQYRGYDNANGKEVTIKVESIWSTRRLLQREISIISKLQFSKYVCRLIHSEHKDNIYYMILGPLSYNLAELRMHQKHCTFSLSTILKFSVQMLKAIEHVHSIGFIHREINPFNFYIEEDLTNATRIYLADFGMATKFYVQKNGAASTLVNPVKHDIKLMIYDSVKGQSCNNKIGRVDDLWSMFYMLLEMRLGKLPWSGFLEPTKIMKLKDDKYVQPLLKFLPNEFQIIYMHYQELESENCPDYAEVYNNLKHAIKRYNIRSHLLFSKRQQSQMILPKYGVDCKGDNISNQVPAVKSNHCLKAKAICNSNNQNQKGQSNDFYKSKRFNNMHYLFEDREEMLKMYLTRKINRTNKMTEKLRKHLRTTTPSDTLANRKGAWSSVTKLNEFKKILKIEERNNYNCVADKKMMENAMLNDNVLNKKKTNYQPCKLNAVNQNVENKYKYNDKENINKKVCEENCLANENTKRMENLEKVNLNNEETATEMKGNIKTLLNQYNDKASINKEICKETYLVNENAKGMENLEKVDLNNEETATEIKGNIKTLLNENNDKENIDKKVCEENCLANENTKRIQNLEKVDLNNEETATEIKGNIKTLLNENNDKEKIDKKVCEENCLANENRKGMENLEKVDLNNEETATEINGNIKTLLNENNDKENIDKKVCEENCLANENRKGMENLEKVNLNKKTPTEIKENIKTLLNKYETSADGDNKTKPYNDQIQMTNQIQIKQPIDITNIVGNKLKVHQRSTSINYFVKNVKRLTLMESDTVVPKISISLPVNRYAASVSHLALLQSKATELLRDRKWYDVPASPISNCSGKLKQCANVNIDSWNILKNISNRIVRNKNTHLITKCSPKEYIN